MPGWTILFFCVQLSSFIFCEYKDSEILCASQQSCKNCLQTPRCVWCSTPVSNQSVNNPLIRCVTREKFSNEGDHWCRTSDVIIETNKMLILENRPLSLTKGTDPVQIQPQKIDLRLRRGEEYRLTLKYSQAEDYPVDLYYLMDLSKSMEDYRDQLSELGFQLAEAMRNLTSNFRLGFGSFVDKVVLPMTSTQPDKLKSPCNLDKTKKPCAPPYGYKNQMPLTENIALFKTRVQEAPVSGNLDSPEGGLDAMMQAMVCTKEIGWRQNARHFIVFSTDANFHIAGDGRLAGIIEPNDCLCHLDSEGFYTYSLLQDYPSIFQINKVARENNMNIIFAVTSNRNETYQLLSRSIRGSSIGTIERNSRNVVALVSGEYEKLVNTIIMTDDAPKMIDVKYFSRCLDKNGELKERQECGGLRVGNIVEFEVTLQAIECPKDSNEWQTSMHIKPRGINESLTINLSIACDCPCERPGHPGYTPASENCRGNGTLVCGICSCDDGFYGKQCECEGNDARAESAAAMSDCRADNETTEICSDHGVCKCGVCECVKRPNPQEVFYGKYCECDNFSCKRKEGLVCGGRGKCECGTCNCFPGWGGEMCDCKETNSTCISSNSETMEICSGRGDCICGSCYCHEKDNIRYSGRYCEECPVCPDQRCEQLKNCVECVVHKSGPLARSEKCDECMHQIDIVDKIVENSEKDQENKTRICRTPGDAGCTFVFKYEYYRDGTGGDIKIFKILAEREKSCPVPINVLGVAVGLIISTVIIGFAILLTWKILTMIRDNREFKKFERERILANKWNRRDNPLYKEATSTFKNPTFNTNTIR
ncbi:integrin beta-PS [Apis mellifera]|uniref:Integrin beta n=1 Tax=Apis mellifera TaxID=7460 RepID=A0A7M7M1H3_APIME|nr:integrin beta-PS [Apis mellifera]|eukprot:XP_016773439.2 integrin beta-PS [Apis mellifera]